jgi:hypothetical protein
MNTLNGIRKAALIATLAGGSLIASATQVLADEAHASAAVAALGHITVLAPRETPIADLGGLTVTASRLTRLSFADLGAITVTAPRVADARFADLGSVTVTAKRGATVSVAAAESSNRFWK